MSTVLPDGTEVLTRFADHFVSTDQDVADLHLQKPESRFCLMELPKEELAQLEKGATFYFKAQKSGKGLDDGGAALCSATSTFSVEFLENSNSLFLASVAKDGGVTVLAGGADPAKPVESAAAADAGSKGVNGEEAPLATVAGAAPKVPEAANATNGDVKKDDSKDASKEANETSAEKSLAKPQLFAEVFAQCRGQLIVKPVKLNMQRLQEMLANQALNGPQKADITPISKTKLAYEVAASAAELDKMLEDGPYVEVDGAWWLLPTKLEQEVIDTSSSLVTARGWNFEDLDPEALLEAVQGQLGKDAVPSVAVLRKCLRTVKFVPGEKKKEPEKTDESKEGDKAAGEKAPSGSPQSSPQKQATQTAETELETPSGEAAALDPNRLALDKGKVHRFQLLQLLKVPPSQVRERFELPLPEPKAKKARTSKPGNRADAGLQVKELAAVMQALTGSVEAKDPAALVSFLGDRVYVDELEGTIHNLDPSALVADPKARLARLMDITTHWRPEKLNMLLTPALPAGTKVDAWIMKLCRQVFVEIEEGKEERFLTKKFGIK